MEIIADTKFGFLIEASKNEVAEIMSSVLGKKPEKIEIGQKLPDIDYAATIRKIQTLEKDYDFQQLLSRLKSVNTTVEDLKNTVKNASNINNNI